MLSISYMVCRPAVSGKVTIKVNSTRLILLFGLAPVIGPENLAVQLRNPDGKLKRESYEKSNTC